MSKVTKNSTIELDYVDQDLGSPEMTFITKCGNRITVKEQDILDFIDLSGMNVSAECDGQYWDPATTETEVITEAACYLDRNFDTVTKLYFQTVIIIAEHEAACFIDGYMSSIKRQGKSVTKSDVSKMMSHVRSEYGINMEVA